MANAGNAHEVESRLRALKAHFLCMESDIADEAAVKGIYAAAKER